MDARTFPRYGTRRRRPALAHAGGAAADDAREFPVRGMWARARHWWRSKRRLVARRCGQPASTSPTHWPAWSAMGGHAGRGGRARHTGSRRGAGRGPRDPDGQRGARAGRPRRRAACGSSHPMCPHPTSARPGSCRRCSRTPSWTASRCGSARGRSFEEMDGTPGNPDSGSVGPGAGSSHALRGHPGHRRRLRLGRGVAAHRTSGHGAQPRQHASYGPGGADRMGPLRHPHPRAARRVCPGHRRSCGRKTGSFSPRRASPSPYGCGRRTLSCPVKPRVR